MSRSRRYESKRLRPGDLGADTKQRIEATCVQAIEGLKRISELKAQAKQFNGNADDVQQRVANLRSKLRSLQSDQPLIPTNLTLPELEQEVSRREVALAELKSAQAKLEVEPSTRANRRRDIRELLLSASQRIADVQKQLDLPPPADEPSLVTDARRYDLQVRRMLIEAEQPALQNELAKYDAEDASDFLRLERDVHMQRARLTSAELQELEGQLSQRRAADSAAAVQRTRDTLATTTAALRPVAQENVTLAETADTLTLPIRRTRHKLEGTKDRLEDLQQQFTMTRQRVSDIGLTGSIGALLRKQRVDLPDVRSRQMDVQERKSLIEDTQYRLFEYDNPRSDSFDSMLLRAKSSLSILDSDDREKLQSVLRSLVDQRRGYLDGIIRNHNTYLDTLFELDATEQRLIR